MVVRFLSGGHKQRGYAVTATAAYSLYGVMRPIPARRAYAARTILLWGCAPLPFFMGLCAPYPQELSYAKKAPQRTHLKPLVSRLPAERGKTPSPSRLPRFLLPSVYFTTKRVVNKVSSLEKLLKKIVKFTATKTSPYFTQTTKSSSMMNCFLYLIISSVILCSGGGNHFHLNPTLLGNQNLAGFTALKRSDNSFFLHRIHQAGSAGIAEF